jgi:hypothetical protein
LQGDVPIAGVGQTNNVTKTFTATSTIINPSTVTDFKTPGSYLWTTAFPLPSDFWSTISCTLTTKFTMNNPTVPTASVTQNFTSWIQDSNANYQFISQTDSITNATSTASSYNKTVSSTATPSGLNANDLVTYNMTCNDATIYMTAISLTFTLTYNTSIPSWTSLYANARFTSSMVLLTPQKTILCFPVMGMYNITFRVRPSYSSGIGAVGQNFAPYLVPLVYLGVMYNDIGVNTRLGERDSLTGLSSTNNTSTDQTLTYTGLFYANDQICLYGYGSANGVTNTSTVGLASITAGSGITFTSTLLQPLHSNATLYKSITINNPNADYNFDEIRYFSGTTDITPFATASSNNMGNFNGTFYCGNMYGGNSSLTATFATPQAVTSVWVRPNLQLIGRFWGVYLTMTDINGVTKSSAPVQPPFGYSYNLNVIPGLAGASYLVKYNLGNNNLLPQWTYGYSTDDLQGNLTFLIIGDSTSYGNDKWAYQLAVWMSNKYTEHSILYYLWDNNLNVYTAPIVFGDYQSTQIISIYNASITGSLATNLMGGKYALAINNLTPNYIWWNQGKNHNVNGTFTQPQVEGELASAVVQVQRTFPNVPIIVTLQPPNLSDSYYDVVKAAWTDLNATLTGVIVVDIYTVFTTASKPATWYSDNYLPSVLGTTQWLNAITSMWPTIRAAPARSTTAATASLNTVVANPYLTGDFTTKTNGATPTGWTSSGSLSIQDSTLVGYNTLTNAMRLSATTSSGPTFLSKSVTASVLTTLIGKPVYLSWQSSMESGSANTVGRAGLRYTVNGVTTTLLSRTPVSDVQSGYYWQSIGPFIVPANTTALAVLLYHDTASTPDSSHAVTYQQVLLTAANLPTTLYNLTASSYYAYPNWQLALNIPTGQDVANLGNDDYLGTYDAINRSVQNNWDGFMTILDGSNHNYYDTDYYNFQIQGTYSSSTLAESYRSQYAFAGYPNWIICMVGIRDGSVLSGNVGFKWVDPNFVTVTGTIATGLSPVQAVAAISGYEIFIMNYNSTTGAYELIRPCVTYNPIIVKAFNADPGNGNVDFYDSQGYFWNSGYTFASLDHFKRTLRKLSGCVGAEGITNSDGSVQAYFKTNVAAYGNWYDKSPTGANDNTGWWYSTAFTPSANGKVQTKCSNGTILTLSNYYFGTPPTTTATYQYPATNLPAMATSTQGFGVASFTNPAYTLPPSSLTAPSINTNVPWKATFFDVSPNADNAYNINSFYKSLAQAQAAPGCLGVQGQSRQYYAKNQIPMTFDYSSQGTYYSPWTVAGTWNTCIGFVQQLNVTTANLFWGAYYTSSACLPLYLNSAANQLTVTTTLKGNPSLETIVTNFIIQNAPISILGGGYFVYSASTTGTGYGTVTYVYTPNTISTATNNIYSMFRLQDTKASSFYGWNSNYTNDAWQSSGQDNNALVLTTGNNTWSFRYVNSQFTTVNNYGIPLYFKVDPATQLLYFCPSSADTFTWSKGSSIVHVQTGKTVMYATTNFGGTQAQLCLAGAARQSSTTAPTFTYLPVFNYYATNVIGSMNQTGTATLNYSLSGMDRSHTWLQFAYGSSGVGFDGGGGSDTTNTNLADAQANTNTYFAIQGGGPVYGKSSGSTVNTGDGRLYSGWLRTGTATQCVGFVVVGGNNGTLFVSSYGYTSVAPTAQIASTTTYALTTNNVQAEILSKMPINNNMGFTYDASIGTYGQVTWLSQI